MLEGVEVNGVNWWAFIWVLKRICHWLYKIHFFVSGLLGGGGAGPSLVLNCLLEISNTVKFADLSSRKTDVSPPTSILDIAQDVKRPFPHNLCKHPTKSKKEILPPLCDSRFSCPSWSVSKMLKLIKDIFWYTDSPCLVHSNKRAGGNTDEEHVSHTSSLPSLCVSSPSSLLSATLSLAEPVLGATGATAS